MCSRNSSNTMDLEIDDSLLEITDIKTENDAEVDINELWNSFVLIKPTEEPSSERGVPYFLELQSNIPTDVSIFVHTDNYTLHRAMLSSKSNYFFAFELQYHGKNMERVISRDFVDYGISSDRFFIIVDMMYGKDLKSIMNEYNYVELFKDMDVLRMEMDLDVFKQFIIENLIPKADFSNDTSMFELYDYILRRRTFKYLISTVSKYFSDRLLKVNKKEELFSISYEGFVRILENTGNQTEEHCSIDRICAEWICADFHTRISYLVDLVNVVKRRYGLLQYCACDKNLVTQTLNEVGEEIKTSEVEKFFKMLFSYNGEISYISSSLNDDFDTETGIRIWNTIDESDRWIEFLKYEWFCDIVFNIQGTIFKLHRIKLISASPYFHSLVINATKSPKAEYSLDQIDSDAFQRVIEYIYKGEIEISSKIELVNLLKASKLLEMNDLFEKCYSKIMEIAKPEAAVLSFELFEFVSKYMKHTELNEILVRQLMRLWPDLDDEPNFFGTSVNVLKEILSLPYLKIKHPDDILNLCSRWIWYDVENRYRHTIEIANAINRNFMMGYTEFKLEKPSNITEYSRQYVKEQLTKILSMASFVPLKIEPDPKLQPHFMVLKKNETLSITDADFDQITSICPKILLTQSTEGSRVKISSPQATLMGDKLFILFTIDKQFYFQGYDHFQGYDPVSNKFISLATDSRMDSSRRYSILNCQDELFFCNGNFILKYSAQLNRWISFSYERSSYKEYTSDGKKLYRILVNKHSAGVLQVPIKVAFLDFKQNVWIGLPDVPVQVEVIVDAKYSYKNIPIKVDVINNELNILFESYTYSFNWTSQKWNCIDNLKTDFFEFTGYEQSILYVSMEEVYLYSPAVNNWILKQKLPTDFQDVFAIHVVDQSS